MFQRVDFQPLVIHHEAFDQVFLESLGGPLTELGASRRTNTITDRKDHGQAIVKHIAAYPTASFLLNL